MKPPQTQQRSIEELKNFSRGIQALNELEKQALEINQTYRSCPHIEKLLLGIKEIIPSLPKTEDFSTFNVATYVVTKGYVPFERIPIAAVDLYKKLNPESRQQLQKELVTKFGTISDVCRSATETIIETGCVSTRPIEFKDGRLTCIYCLNGSCSYLESLTK